MRREPRAKSLDTLVRFLEPQVGILDACVTTVRPKENPLAALPTNADPSPVVGPLGRRRGQECADSEAGGGSEERAAGALREIVAILKPSWTEEVLPLGALGNPGVGLGLYIAR